MPFPADRRIRLLDPRLANQIAAGEVVERPASVLKELLENSVDSGAARIDIELERGGVGLIRVRDDGCGIRRDDLPLALSRHATSKLYDQKELERIGTLGFRGEALAAIGSVSRLTLTSRHADEPHAWMVEPGSEPAPAAQPQGTTVEVRDLFFNVPARRKFLRGERTELAHLEEVARRIALSRFDLQISLRHDGRNLLELRPAQGEAAVLRRVGEACGAPFSRAARPVGIEAAGMSLTGWVLPAEQARPQSDLQYFFVNGRMVRDRLIAHAVRTAFGEAVPEGRFPGYLLYLTLDPTAVDVNVHPTKHEVRFRDARLTHDFLAQGVRRALEQPTLFVDAGPERPAATAVPALRAEREAADSLPPRGGFAGSRAAVSPRRVAEASGLYGRLFPAREPAGGVTLGRPLGRVGNCLVGSEGDCLVLVDLPAALRLLLAARLEGSWRSGTITSQPLLVPESVQLGPAALIAVERGLARLQRLGIEVEPIGASALAVRALPSLLRRAPVAPLMEKVLHWLVSGEEGPPFADLATFGGEELPEARDPERLLRALAELGEAGRSVWRRLDGEALAALCAGG